MAVLRYLSHPQVAIDPAVPVPDWGLSETGRARVAAAAARGWPAGTARIIASAERKAQETAAILAAALGLPVETCAAMGEIDRSATGYVPHDRHEELADLCFAVPEASAAGWERAVDAQARIIAAAAPVLAAGEDVLLVGHGGVGTLLWCHLAGRPIARAEDQGPGGGQVWTAALPGGAPRQPWHPMEAAT